MQNLKTIGKVVLVDMLRNVCQNIQLFRSIQPKVSQRSYPEVTSRSGSKFEDNRTSSSGMECMNADRNETTCLLLNYQLNFYDVSQHDPSTVHNTQHM